MTLSKQIDAPHRAIIAISLLLLMITRYHHFGSMLLLPDASWSVFIAAGFYLYRFRWMVVFFALAGLIDYFAITHGGTDSYCISAAYPFLIPAYAVLWWGGRWLSRCYTGQTLDLVRLFAISMVAVTVCFVISDASFYWFSGQVENVSLAGYWQSFLHYFPNFLKITLIYLSVFAALHAVVAILRDIYDGGVRQGSR